MEPYLRHLTVSIYLYLDAESGYAEIRTIANHDAMSADRRTDDYYMTGLEPDEHSARAQIKAALVELIEEL